MGAIGDFSRWRFEWKLDALELLEMLRDGVIIVDASENRVVAWNAAAEAIFGYTSAEAIGMSVSDLAPERLVARHEAGIARYAATGAGHFVENHDPLELPALTKSGEEIYVEFQLSPILNSPDGRLYATAVVRDVTERVVQHEAQKQLQEIATAAQRFEAIGGLATGVAHDFNNLLTVITTRIGAILDEGGADPEQVRSLQAVLEAADRGASLSRQMLEFASKSIVTPSALSLNDALEEAATFLQLTLGPTIKLEMQLTADLPRTMMDASQVDQVFANLALNARDAMPDGGTFIISTDVVKVPPRSSDPKLLNVPPGLYVRVRVEDTGTGMSETTLRRIFEPFFTTKPRGRGTGMGLATVYGIINQAGGYIRCESAPGRGTLFEILLPEASIAEDLYVEEEIAPVIAKQADILLVDDDEALLRSVAKILERGGHRVTAATSPTEAIRLAETGRRFDLLVSDVVMPEMNGVELARTLRSKGAVQTVLLMSGYPEGALPSKEQIEQGMTLLQKPFTREQILKLVAFKIDPASTRAEGTTEG